ncbi:5-hydroxyisourate hydrolase [Sagittula marina]|uniref:5-hydroxyisourate hydrolase n=1 Tax=Sagittula marina TaxID=943940 RepID=A0A7W6DRS7_9RHOB|nr:hydroxyisourate hydrolase [Sagittula marina]MBB3987787.1 5-hydroxyisourate hydrolase [Sagittula marina]
MIRTIFLAALSAAALAGAAQAEDISTHVLNISTGEGGAGIPVMLEIEKDGEWAEVGSGVTGNNGRVEGFGVEAEDAQYRLTFDMTKYDANKKEPFFPEITVTFDVQDAERHHHVPVLVSAYGFSTYLGN